MLPDNETVVFTIYTEFGPAYWARHSSADPSKHKPWGACGPHGCYEDLDHEAQAYDNARNEYMQTNQGNNPMSASPYCTFEQTGGGEFYSRTLWLYRLHKPWMNESGIAGPNTLLQQNYSGVPVDVDYTLLERDPGKQHCIMWTSGQAIDVDCP